MCMLTHMLSLAGPCPMSILSQWVTAPQWSNHFPLPAWTLPPQAFHDWLPTLGTHPCPCPIQSIRVHPNCRPHPLHTSVHRALPAALHRVLECPEHTHCGLHSNHREVIRSWGWQAPSLSLELRACAALFTC